MSELSSPPREYLISEGLVCSERDVAETIEILDHLFMLGEFSDEGFVINDGVDGTTHGTTTQEYLFFRDPKLEAKPNALPWKVGLDIGYTKHPSPQGPCDLSYDVSIRLDDPGWTRSSTHHFNFLQSGGDGTAWAFAPDDGTEHKNLKVGSWQEMDIQELDMLHSILELIYELQQASSTPVDASR